MLLPFLLLAAGGVAQGDGDRAVYVLETREVRRIDAVLTWRVHCPRLHAREWIGFVAQAPELPGQVNVKTTSNPQASLLDETSPLHRKVLRVRLPVKTAAEATDFEMKAGYQATLRSRHLNLLAPGRERPTVADLAPGERKAALISYGELDHGNAVFHNWLVAEHLNCRATEDHLSFARRVFAHLRSTFSYAYEPKQDRRASQVCRVSATDCGGLSILFVAALRANGVPARTLYGRWAKSSTPDDKLAGFPYSQWHVKAEFFVESIGWIPVDVSAGNLPDNSPRGLQYFGHDSGRFFTQHVDPSFEVDALKLGHKSLENLQSPGYWVTGEGSTNGSDTTQEWQVRNLP